MEKSEMSEMTRENQGSEREDVSGSIFDSEFSTGSVSETSLDWSASTGRSIEPEDGEEEE